MSDLRLTGIGRASEPPPLPTAALRVRGHVPRALLAQHAIAPEDAVAFAGESTELTRLRAANLVRAVPDGRLWLDLVAYHQRERARKRAAAVGAVGVALIVAFGLMLLYRG